MEKEIVFVFFTFYVFTVTRFLNTILSIPIWYRVHYLDPEAWFPKVRLTEEKVGPKSAVVNVFKLYQRIPTYVWHTRATMQRWRIYGCTRARGSRVEAFICTCSSRVLLNSICLLLHEKETFLFDYSPLSMSVSTPTSKFLRIFYVNISYERRDSLTPLEERTTMNTYVLSCTRVPCA